MCMIQCVVFDRITGSRNINGVIERNYLDFQFHADLLLKVGLVDR